MDYLNEIKARLGSVATSKMKQLPLSVQKLLKEDLPRLLRAVEGIDKVLYKEIPKKETSKIIEEVTHLNALAEKKLGEQI